MLVAAVLILSLFDTIVCRSPAVTPFHPQRENPLSEHDWEKLRSLPSHRTGYPANFTQLYLGKDGQLVKGSRPEGEYLKVVGSPLASEAAVYRVAGEIQKMLRLTPPHIFDNLVNEGCGIGVFAAAEKLTVFPEYYPLRDTPECHGTCEGYCSRTCTRDGRKWETVGGIGGRMALVTEENVMCVHDQYHDDDNIAIHEFAHTIDHHGFDMVQRLQKDDAYNAVKARNVWLPGSYAMSNSFEYFAEASGVFFGVNHLRSSGGMNTCGEHPCSDEITARQNIRLKDPKLYSLLLDVYLSGAPSGLTICPPS